MIVTKSVSRFARNTVDSLVTIRKLKEVGCECYFEKENIYTFDGKGELLLTIMSSLAQEDATDILWAEAFSNDPTSSTRTTNYSAVTAPATATDGTNVYTLINDFKVRLNPTTGVALATNLKVQSVTVGLKDTNTDDSVNTGADALKNAVRVLFVSGDNWVIYNAGTGAFTTKTEANVLAASVSASDATNVKVYIYFDGEDEATTTNNATALSPDGYTVEFALSID